MWSASFTSEHAPLLIVCAFVPLWLAWWAETSWLRIALAGWLAQLTFVILAHGWVRYAAWSFFGTTGVRGWLVLFGFGSVAYLHVPLTGVLFAWCRRHIALGPRGTLSVLVLLATSLEWLAPRVFPCSVGGAWVLSNLDVMQLADWVGFDALGSVAFVVNALLLRGWIARRRSRLRTFVTSMAAAALLVASLCALGRWHVRAWPAPDASLRAHLLQPHVLPVEMIALEEGEARAIDISVGELLRLEHHPRLPADVAIWPETALPIDLTADSEQARRVQAFVRGQGTALITGSYHYANRIKHNSITYLDAGGRVVQTYDKNRLMPYGEYLPGERFAPFLRTLLPQVPTYGAGRFAAPIVLGDALLGPSICYEAAFPQHVRRTTADHANVLLNLASDVWFGPDLLPVQHSAIARMRAIEFRRPLIRVSDSGISSVFAASGAVLAAAPAWQAWQRTVRVPYLKQPPRTFYDQHGAWMGEAFALLLAAYLLWARSAARPHRAAHAMSGA